MITGEKGGLSAMFINYAHRGASACAPENTMRSFRLGVRLGANGIETDIRRTKDGVLVLFHDRDLFRLTGVRGTVSALSFAELSALRVRTPGTGEGEPVPTLTEFLRFIEPLSVFLALELKDGALEAETVKAVRAFGIADRTVITSFEAAHLQNVKRSAPQMKVGLLTRTVTKEILFTLKALGAEQICPKADILTPALVRSLHGEGFNVRAWGVGDEATMKRAFHCGVDGMTVNFPDRLRALLREKE